MGFWTVVLSPELSVDQHFIKIWSDPKFKHKINCIIVDEAHCVTDHAYLHAVDTHVSGKGPVPVQPGLVSTGIDPMCRGPASLKGPPSLLSQRPKQSVQGLYRD